MEQSQETATESKAERHRRLRHKRERSVIKLQFLQRCTQILVIIWIDWINARKHHRLNLLETIDSLSARFSDMRNSIADLHLLRVLDATDDIAHITCRQLFLRHHIHLQDTNLIGRIFHSGIKELHLVTLSDYSVLNLKVCDDASKRVEHRIEDQRLQRCFYIPLWMRYTFYNSRKYISHALASLSACANYLRAVAAY